MKPGSEGNQPGRGATRSAGSLKRAERRAVSEGQPLLTVTFYDPDKSTKPQGLSAVTNKQSGIVATVPAGRSPHSGKPPSERASGSGADAAANPPDSAELLTEVDSPAQKPGAALPEKLDEAIADEVAKDVVDRTFPCLTVDNQAEPFPAAEAKDIEAVSGWLQHAASSAFEAPATELGLPPAAAAFSADVCTNLVLAPITGPLNNAATCLEIAGVAVGLMTGAHPLVLACVKPLVHTELEHMVSEGILDVVRGPQAAAPAKEPDAVPERPDAEDGPAAHPEAPHARRDPTPDYPRWLCFAFVAKAPAGADPAFIASAPVPAERDGTAPVVLRPGDDTFLATLPDVLRGATVIEVDVTEAKAMTDLPKGTHLSLRIGGVGLSVSGTTGGTRSAQHPGCQTGDCAPPGSRCLCRCDVCSRLPGAQDVGGYDVSLQPSVLGLPVVNVKNRSIFTGLSGRGHAGQVVQRPGGFTPGEPHQELGPAWRLPVLSGSAGQGVTSAWIAAASPGWAVTSEATMPTTSSCHPGPGLPQLDGLRALLGALRTCMPRSGWFPNTRGGSLPGTTLRRGGMADSGESDRVTGG